ncbi:MAG: galactokinase [Actinomycetota bacterium]
MLEESQISQKFLLFEERFGRGEVIDAYYAPGRVNLIGDHTDYNGGMVLPLAIEKGTYLLVRRTELPPCRLYSANLDLEARILTSELEPKGDWADYVRGVYKYSSEYCGGLPPFDAYYFGDLPLESGLSSSASIEVVTARAMNSLGCALSHADEVKVAWRAENEFVGVPCGIMDQYAVAFAEKGHCLLLDCETMEHRQVPFNVRDCVLVVGNTGMPRNLAQTEYRKRRLECAEALEALSTRLGPHAYLSAITVKEFESARWGLPDLLARRAEHVIYENVRVEEAARCLQAGDARTLGHLMNRSHESLRDLYEVSTHELDALQQISLEQQGVLGSRMTGAGFGGCVVSLVARDSLERYLRRTPGLYWQATHEEAEFTVTTPGDGARRLREAT